MFVRTWTKRGKAIGCIRCRQGASLRPEDPGRMESEPLEGFVARSTGLLGPLAGELTMKRLVGFPYVSAGTVDGNFHRISAKSDTSLRRLAYHPL